MHGIEWGYPPHLTPCEIHKNIGASDQGVNEKKRRRDKRARGRRGGCPTPETIGGAEVGQCMLTPCLPPQPFDTDIGFYGSPSRLLRSRVDCRTICCVFVINFTK